jgi:hypothetical protein
VGQQDPALELAWNLTMDEYHVLTRVNKLTRFGPGDREAEFFIHRGDLGFVICRMMISRHNV